MGKPADEAGSQTLDELILRITAYRESAAATRRLARAITDQRAAKSLIDDAAEFERKAEAIASQIDELAHHHQDD